jgi:holo-[acyl-carrier protein] synthase
MVVSPGGAQVKAALRVLVGLDLVQISSIAASVDRFGSRFLKRIFTDEELLYCMAAPGPSASRLAARFAAKEAVRKVLCLGDEAVAWRSIEVVRASSGWCDVVLHGEARRLAQRAGCTGLSLSMTHESDYASAVVVCERHRESDAWK